MSEKLKIESCFTCTSKVHEFEDNQFGCSNCGSIWSFNGKGWETINTNEIKPKKEWQQQQLPSR